MAALRVLAFGTTLDSESGSEEFSPAAMAALSASPDGGAVSDCVRHHTLCPLSATDSVPGAFGRLLTSTDGGVVRHFVRNLAAGVRFSKFSASCHRPLLALMAQASGSTNLVPDGLVTLFACTDGGAVNKIVQHHPRLGHQVQKSVAPFPWPLFSQAPMVAL